MKAQEHQLLLFVNKIAGVFLSVEQFTIISPTAWEAQQFFFIDALFTATNSQNTKVNIYYIFVIIYYLFVGLSNVLECFADFVLLVRHHISDKIVQIVNSWAIKFDNVNKPKSKFIKFATKKYLLM